MPFFFQNASFLWLLAPLAALPLVIHLLNRKFPRTIRFSSIQFIVRSMAQRSRLLRWRHVLMTLLRTLIVALLVVVFLRPRLLDPAAPRPEASAGGRRCVLLVVDRSLSMESADGLQSPRSRALTEARRLLDSLDAADEVNVLAAGRATGLCFLRPSDNHGAARDYLAGLGPAWERADWTRAMEQCAAQLSGKPAAACEVCFFSDFQRTGWADAAFTALPAGVRLLFVPVVPPGEVRGNRAVSGVEGLPAVAVAGARMETTVAVANHAAEPFDGQLEIVFDGRSGAEVPVRAAPWSVQRVPLTLTAPGPGLHELAVRLKEPDALPADDTWSAALEVQAREELVILTDHAMPPGAAGDSALTLRYLEAALNPFADGRGSLMTRRLTAAEITAPALASVRRVVATRSAVWPDATLDVLTNWMKAGGGMLCFLDGPGDRRNLEALAERCGDAAAVPLRLQARLEASQVAGGALHFARGQFETSRWLRLFRGPARSQFARLEFYDVWRASAAERSAVVLTYDDGTPALAAGSPGLGTLLLANFSVAEISSNLARQRLFPAWLQELAIHLAGDSAARDDWRCGDVMSRELWNRDAAAGNGTGPDGGPVRFDRIVDGERLTVSTAAAAPGFFRLPAARAGSGPAVLLAANADPRESDLRPMEAGALPAHAAGDGAAAAGMADAGADYEHLRRGTPVHHWFALAALAVMAGESLLTAFFRRLSSRTAA